MADPLSVATSLVGILAAAVQVTQTLTKIIKNVKDAPEQCRHMCAEVNDIRQVTEQLQAFLLGTSTASRSRTSLILVEQVLVALTSCVTSFSDLDGFVKLLDSDIKMGLMDRLRWSLKVKDMSKVITRLQMQKATMTVMLSILTCQSVIEAKTMVDQLCELVERTLDSNETMVARLRDLEPRMISRLSDIQREVIDQDSLSGSPGLKLDTIHRTTLGFAFEEILMQSRAYKQSVLADTEAYSVSLVSTAGRTGSWTMLSGLSLADMSNVAVLALPLNAHEISNHQHYSSHGAISTSGNDDCASRDRSALERPNSHIPFPILLKGAWRNVRKGTRLSRHPELKLQVDEVPSIFGVPLRQSMVYANSAARTKNDGRSYIYGFVPLIVAECGSFLREQSCHTENIFVVNGQPQRINILEQVFSMPPRYGRGHPWDRFTVFDAASVLLLYMKRLPEPIVPHAHYDGFIDALLSSQPSPDECDVGLAITKYQELLEGLPPLNRQLLMYLMDLLAFFASKAADNPITLHRIVASFHPSIISRPPSRISDDDYDVAQRVVKFLVENQEKIFGQLYANAVVVHRAADEVYDIWVAA